MLSIPVLGTTFIYLLGLDGGLNSLLARRRPRRPRPGLVRNPEWCCRRSPPSIIYHELGFGVVLFLARLLSLPEEVDQAARIDGCTWWQRCGAQITLPQMRGVIIGVT